MSANPEPEKKCKDCRNRPFRIDDWWKSYSNDDVREVPDGVRGMNKIHEICNKAFTTKRVPSRTEFRVILDARFDLRLLEIQWSKFEARDYLLKQAMGLIDLVRFIPSENEYKGSD